MDKQWNTILCPVDYSDFSAMALRYAVAFAEHYNSRLVIFRSLPELVNAEDLPETFDYPEKNWMSGVRQHLETFVKDIASSHLEVIHRIEPSSSPASGILAAVKQESAASQVTGTGADCLQTDAELSAGKFSSSASN
jgi:hypothetical protein